MNILLQENFISREYQDSLEELLMGVQFPFFINRDGTLGPVDSYTHSGSYSDKNTRDSPQFTHVVINNGVQNSPYWSNLLPLLHQAIKTFNMELEVVRCKVNLNHRSRHFLATDYYPPHVDHSDPSLFVGIYYVNDCDGDTIFFNPPALNVTTGEFKIVTRVRPKKGQFVFFPASVVHAGVPPRISELRCVVNFVFKVQI